MGDLFDLYAIASVEALLVGSISLAYYLVVGRRLVSNALTVAKVITATYTIWGFTAVGAIFMPLVLVASFLPHGPRGANLTVAALFPFIAGSGIGLIYGAWLYLTFKPRQPTPHIPDVPVDGESGWPLYPAFVYGRKARDETSNLIFVTATWIPLTAAMTCVGADVVLSRIWPQLSIASLEDFARGFSVEDSLLFLGLGLLGLIGGAALLWASWKAFFQTRPFTVNDRGLYTFYRGKPRAFLPWGEIKSITKLRRDMPEGPYARVEITIEAKGGVLLLNSDLIGYEQACNMISACARKHGIRMRFIDKWRGAIKPQRARLTRAAYRGLRRTGVVTEVSDL